MSAHTKGDWEVMTESPNEYWRGDGTEVLSEYGRIADTSVGGLRNTKEAQANARLIAAAPDLLASLRELLDWQAAEKHATPLIFLERARAAVAKAMQP